MDRTDVIARTRAHMQELLSGEGTGHDWWHVSRVTASALTIGRLEGADLYVVELAALTRDIADWKFHEDPEAGPNAARVLLEGLGVEPEVIDEVTFIVRHISFKGGTNAVPMRTLEGQVVQDADRLDALGAIGVARAFAFGGSRSRPLHDPSRAPSNPDEPIDPRRRLDEGTTIAHFYDKLLLLKDRMNTATGRAMAEQRHAYMVGFLEQFYAEWEGER